MCMERRFSQTMASEWQTAFVVSHKMPCLAQCRQELQQKSWKTARLFLQDHRPRPRPNVQDQDQNFMIQDQDQDFHFCPRDASRPRPWSWVLHHCNPSRRHCVARCRSGRALGSTPRRRAFGCKIPGNLFTHICLCHQVWWYGWTAFTVSGACPCSVVRFLATTDLD